jgi:hypothetical protein
MNTLGVALIGAIATLMAFAHSRSAHLSEKARENITELLYSVPNLKSKVAAETISAKTISAKTISDIYKSLEAQSYDFLIRCKRMNKAFCSLAVSLIVVMLALVVSTPGVVPPVQVTGVCLARVLAVIAAGFIVYALVLAGKEFYYGLDTLTLHIYSALGHQEKAKRILDDMERIRDKEKFRGVERRPAPDDNGDNAERDGGDGQR